MSNMFPDRIQIEELKVERGVRWFRTLSRNRQITRYGIATSPRNFHTDGASIPKAFHSIIGPFGLYFAAALTHDWLYTKASQQDLPLTRKQADQVFLDGMEHLGVNLPTRHAMHRAVRLFGWRSYQKR